MVGVGRHGSHAERALAAADDRGARRVTGGRQGKQRAGGPGAAGNGAARGGGWTDVCCGGRGGEVSQRRCDHLSGAAVQSDRAWGAGDRPWAGATTDLRRGGAGADRGDGPAGTGSEGGWDGDLVPEHAGADAASGGAPSGGGDDDPTGAARRGQLVP